MRGSMGSETSLSHQFSSLTEPVHLESLRISRPPIAIRCSVGAGEHDEVSVGIAQPAFPIVRSAVPLRRITMAGQHDLGSHLFRARYGGIEVVNLKPQEHTIS